MHSLRSILALSLAFSLATTSCSKKKSDATSDAPAAAQTKNSTERGAAKPTASAASPEQEEPQDEQKEQSENHRDTFTWAKLQTWDINDDISPPAELPNRAEDEDKTEGTPLLFSRLAGGRGRFCGVLRSGPIQCWGKEAALYKGRFIDVAIADHATCGVTAQGELECWGRDAPSNLSKIKRIAARGEHVCSLDEEDKVHCFTTGAGEALSPPEHLLAKYFTVGGGFACAADVDSKLRCWGDVANLKLPTAAPIIRDVAAGEAFVCALTETAETVCFGSHPVAPQGETQALSAAYEDLCALAKGGQLTCVGGLDLTFADAKKVAVGATAVCALGNSGVARCKGNGDEGQLLVPRDPSKTMNAPAPKAVSQEIFAKFLGLFPLAPLPQSFDRAASFDVGDRLPMQFADLVGGDANTYRTGVRLGLPTSEIALTLLNLKTGKMELHTFTSKGKPVKIRTLAGREQESGATEEAEDGTGVRTFVASATESTVNAEGLIAGKSYEGKEVTHYVKQHLDGSRPVSRIECTITGTSWTDAIGKDGSLVRKAAKVLPRRSTTDEKGCLGAWPMGG